MATTPPAERSTQQPDTSGRSAARNLRNGLILLVVFGSLVLALLLSVPSLRSVARRMADANLGWLLAGVGLEVLSCASFMVLFQLIFARLGGRLARRLALAELAVNAVVSAGGLGGLALGAWVLHTKGISAERILRRSVVLYVLTSAVNVGAVLLIGLPMWLGLLPGSTNPLLTLLPALAAAATIAGALAVAALDRRAVKRGQQPVGRAAVAVRAIGDGIEGAVELLREHDWRLLGAVGYWLFDNLVLYTSLLAFGSRPSFGAVAMAYLVGMLANSIPIPGGFVAVEGGLVGMLLLFGARPSGLVLAAVLTYRAIALWVPSIIGTVAFFGLRREIGTPLAAQRQ